MSEGSKASEINIWANLVKIIGAYVGLDIQCRYQFRNIEDLNDPIPIPQQYLNIKNFKYFWTKCSEFSHQRT